MKLLFTSFFSIMMTIASAQPNLQWIEQFGTANGDAIYSVVTDPSGNVYSTGGENGKVKIHKRDALGNYIWTKTVNGTTTSALGYSIALDGDGNLVVSGMFDGTGDFDPGASYFNLTSNGSTDIFVLKLNASGNFIWAASVGGTGIDRGYSITTDALNNVIVTGVHQNTVDFDPGVGVDNYTAGGGLWDYFVLKLNTNGVYQWAISSQNSGSEYSNSVACDASNNIYITGDFSATHDFDPGTGVASLTPPNATAGYVLKLDASGSLVWVKMLAGGGRCYPSTVDIDANGDVVTSGEYTLNLDADPGTGAFMLTSNGEQDVYIIKLTSSGNFVWGKSFGATVPDESFGLTTDASNNIYTTGYYEGNVDFDPGVGVSTLSSNGIFDVFVQKLDSNGDFVWAVGMGGSSWDRGADLAVYQPSGSLYVAGYFNTTVDFDPGMGTTNLTSIGGSDGFLLKFSDCVASSPVPDLTSLPDLTGDCSIDAPTLPTASNCTGVYDGSPDVTFPITTLGTTVITWTYDDGMGNTTTQTQNVIVSDDVAPVADVTTLPNITAECEVTSLIAPTATDNCAGSVTGTHDAALPITSQGTTTVTWTYDDGHGNITMQTQNVIISDAVAPVADVTTLSNIIAECEVISLIAPTATDNCVGAVTGTHDATLPITSQGTTTVTWTYDDGHGNMTTQTQNVIISDAVAPVADVTTLPNITAECEVTSLIAPTATDNCAGSVTGTHDATLPITSQGTTTVTWTYNDGHGNMTTQTQDVIIEDVTAPVADVASLSDISTECPVTSLTAPTATDNCSSSVTVTNDATLPISTQGTTTITWTYDDGNGNTSTQTQDVIITPINDGITAVDAITLSADASGYNYQWVDCDNNNEPIVGATSQVFTPATAGNYACMVDNGTCSILTNCLTSSVGIDENSAFVDLVVYPNPTFGDVTIDLGETYGNIDLSVYDLLGKKVFGKQVSNASSIELNVEGVPGVYTVEIKSEDGGTARIKVIKK